MSMVFSDFLLSLKKSPPSGKNKPDTGSGCCIAEGLSDGAGGQAQLGDFLVQQVDTLGHALDQAVGNPRIALHQAEELFLGDHHHRAGLAGQYGGATALAGEYGHGPEYLVFLYVPDLVAIDIGFGVAFDDDKYVIGGVALMDQFFSGGKVLKAGRGPDIGLLEACQGIGEQGGMADQVLDKQFLTLLAGIDVLEHIAARIGNQVQLLFAAVAAAGHVQALAQADQVAFLQVEQRALIDCGMQQAVFDDEQLVARQYGRQIFDPFQLQGRANGVEPFEQLAGDALQSVDQLIGVSRLLPE